MCTCLHEAVGSQLTLLRSCFGKLDRQGFFHRAISDVKIATVALHVVCKSQPIVQRAIRALSAASQYSDAETRALDSILRRFRDVCSIHWRYLLVAFLLFE